MIRILLDNQKQGCNFDFQKNDLRTIADNILKTADTEWGGFGNAPKFPQTFIIQYSAYDIIILHET